MKKNKVPIMIPIFLILLTNGIIAYSQSPNNMPPNCSQAFASPSILWPPDQQFHQIELVGVNDPDGDEIRMQIINIIQNEPISRLFPVDSGPDAIIEPLQIKSERWDQGNGRLYVIRFKALDGRGGVCTGEATVCVPLEENSTCPAQSSFPQGYISTNEALSQLSSLDIQQYEELKNSGQLSSYIPVKFAFTYNEKKDKSFLNYPPDCSEAYPSRELLYPADGLFQSINIEGISEPENDLVVININEVLQDEPLDISADGNIEPSAFYFVDDEGTFSGTIKLKAKIGLNQDQRAYFIHYTALDSEGGACSGFVKVCIVSDAKDKCKKCKKDKEVDDKHCNIYQGYDAMFEGIAEPSGYCGCTEPDCLWCRNNNFPTADDCCSFKGHRTIYNVRERYCYVGSAEGAPWEAPASSNVIESNCHSIDICNINDWTCWMSDPGCGIWPCPFIWIVCKGDPFSRVCPPGHWCVGEWNKQNFASEFTEWNNIAKAETSSGFRPWDCDCVDQHGGRYATSSARSFQGNFYGDPQMISLQQPMVHDAGSIYNKGWQWSQIVKRGYYCAKLIALKGDLVCKSLGTPNFLPDISRSGIIGNPNFEPPSSSNCSPCVCP